MKKKLLLIGFLFLFCLSAFVSCNAQVITRPHPKGIISHGDTIRFGKQYHSDSMNIEPHFDTVKAMIFINDTSNHRRILGAGFNGFVIRMNGRPIWYLDEKKKKINPGKHNEIKFLICNCN